MRKYLVALVLLFNMNPLLADESQLLGQLRTFMFDNNARREFANQRPDAKNANQFMEKFPPWAQQEIMEIVMMIMAEKGKGADQYAVQLQGMKPEAAAANFSPQVRERVRALEAKLSATPTFNNQQNLETMKRAMPGH